MRARALAWFNEKTIASCKRADIRITSSLSTGLPVGGAGNIQIATTNSGSF